jgi:hypothetical protein
MMEALLHGNSRSMPEHGPSAESSGYRAAVALNNTGVSLLGRGAYRDAMVTLKESVYVLRQQYGAASRLADDQSNSMARALRLAEKRLAAASHSPAANGTVCPISFDGSVFHGLDFCVDHPAGPASLRYFPAWIECSQANACDNSLEGNHHRHDYEFQSALILYNFALAHLCVARDTMATLKHQSAPVANVEPLFHGAMQLLKMVDSIIDNGSHWTMSWEEPRLLVTCLSFMFMNEAAQQVGNSISEPVSDRLFAAVDAWHKWSQGTAGLFEDATMVRWVVPVMGGPSPDPTKMQLRVYPSTQKASAA